MFHSGRGKGLPPCPQWGTEADDNGILSVGTGYSLGTGFFFNLSLWDAEPYFSSVGFALETAGPGHKCRNCQCMWPLYSPQFHQVNCPVGREISRAGGIPRDWNLRVSPNLPEDVWPEPAVIPVSARVHASVERPTAY